MNSIALGTLATLVVTPLAHAGGLDTPRILVDSIEVTDGDSIRLRLMAIEPDGAGTVEPPEQIDATLVADGVSYPVKIICPRHAEAAAEGGAASLAIATCSLALPASVNPVGQMQLMLDPSAPTYALSPQADRQPALASAAPVPAPSTHLASSAIPSATPDSGNAYLGNLSAYAPIYAAYGPDTNSEARIQISFKYQLFGQAGDVGKGGPFINGLHFGYTQRLFWDLGADSSPFRNIDFMPELFFLQPAVDLGDGFALGGQVGLRHESNGRDGESSRSANTFYIQPAGTFDTGDLTVSVGPRLFLYVGDREDNPDIRHFRGSTGLFFEIGQDDGFRLTANSRLNFSSGKGTIDGELSYPLDRIVDTGLNLYVFGQAFAGYGENLLDYDRRTTRLRAGFAIVR